MVGLRFLTTRAMAALVVLVSIGGVVTVYVVTEKYESLHYAALNGDMFAVRCFLLRGADVNAKEGMVGTPLHRAVRRGRTEVAKLLIARGANVNAKNNHGLTPLHWAALQGQKDVAEVLLALIYAGRVG